MRRLGKMPSSFLLTLGFGFVPAGALRSAEPILAADLSAAPYLLLHLLALVAALGCLALFLQQRRKAAAAQHRLELQRLLLTQHYQNLSRHANDLILLSSGDGRIIEANQRALTRYGYTRQQMLGMNLAGLGASCPPDAGAGIAFESEHRDSTGATFPVEVRVRTVEVAGASFRQLIVLDLTERKRADAALQESLRRFQALTDLAPSGIFQTNDAGRLIYANRLMLEMANINSDDMHGQDWLNAVHPQDRSALAAQWSHCQATGEPISTGFRFLTALGGELPVVCHAAPLRSPSGGAAGFIGVVSDISRVRQAELREKQSTEMVRMIVEGSPVAIAAVDLDDRTTLWNGASELLFGWRREEVIGQPIRGIPPEESESRKRMRDAVLAGGTVRGAEVTRLRQDGKRLSVSVSAAPLRDAEGEIIGVISVLADITERKNAEKALRDTTELLRLSQHMARLGSWRVEFPHWPCSHEDALWEWSGETFRILGLSPNTVTPSWPEFLNRVHPEDVDLVRRHTAAALEHRGRYEANHRIVHDGGAILHVYEHAEIQLDASGRPLGMTGTIQDITTYRKLEDQLIQAQKLDGLGRLAGGVAHDFNNLLTVILGFSEMLLEPAVAPAEARQHALEIQRAASRAETLVRQLLAFGRKQLLSPRSTDLNQVISECQRMLELLLGDESQLITRLTPNLPPIWADPSQIEQVLMHLVVNSRDAMPAGGRLTIQTGVVDVESGDDPLPGRYVELVVADTGTGIDMEVRSHLFEPFFTTKPQGQGAGLGLATVYGIVHQSEGSVRLQSQPGPGAAFQILLPLSRAEVRLEAPVAPPVPLPVPQPVPATSRTILVVDDEDGVRNVVGLTLRRRGFAVLEAEQAQDAIRISREYKGEIHLLLTDVVLPGMNGQELAELLHEDRPAMNVMFCSGYPKGSRLESDSEFGRYEYLQKPFSTGELVKRVENSFCRG